MKSKDEIVKNWLPRYTGEKLDNFGEYILLTNFSNYVNLFAIVKQRMHQPSPLLEKIADEIIGKIRVQYPFIREVIISIYKLQAPIGNFQGKAGMTLHKKFDG